MTSKNKKQEEWISASEFARRLKISKPAVTYRLKNGDIQYKKKGKGYLIEYHSNKGLFDSAPTDEGIVRKNFEVVTGVKGVKSTDDFNPQVDNQVDSFTPSSNSKNASTNTQPSFEEKPKTIQEAKLQHETYRALNEQLKFGKLSGELVLVEDVKNVWVSKGVDLRKSLLAIPDRVCHEISVMKDSRAINKLLRDEIKQSLETLADNMSE